MFWKWLLELRSHNLDSSGSWRLGDGIVLTDTATGHLARVQVISSSQPGRAPWEEALRERVDDWFTRVPLVLVEHGCWGVVYSRGVCVELQYA